MVLNFLLPLPVAEFFCLVLYWCFCSAIVDDCGSA